MMVVMIKLIARIGIVALLTCVSAFGAMADDNYVYPPGAEPFDYGDDFSPELLKSNPYNEVDVPDFSLTSAYNDFMGTYLDPDPIEAFNGQRVLGLKHLDGNLQPDIFDHGILLTVPECINALCDKLTNRGANIIDTIRLLEANGFFQRFRGQGGERGLC